MDIAACQAQDYSEKEWRAKAVRAEKLSDWYSAINYYEKAYNKAKQANLDPGIRYSNLAQLAKLHRKTRDYEEAALYYGQLSEERSAEYPKARFSSGLMLQQSGRYDSAKTVLQKVISHYDGPSLRKTKKRAQIALEGCKKALAKNDKPQAQLYHAGQAVNSAYTEYSPVWKNDSTILYASRKQDSVIRLKRGGKVKGHLKTRFYTARQDSPGYWKDLGLWEKIQDNSENVGNGAFSPNKNRFYFTKCGLDRKKDMMQCAIYMARKTSNGWSRPKKLNEDINQTGSTNTQPAMGIMEKGRKKVDVLFFVSDRKRGKGGKDIWFAFYDKESGKHSRPKNAGRKVNTAWDEVTPYMDHDQRMLYFSSEGKPGYGGLDVYKVPVTGRRIMAEPEHLQSPVNSGADDLYFNPNQRQAGVFVSNREGSIALKHPTCCDDIYTVEFPEAFESSLEGVVKAKPLSGPDSTLKPLEGVKVTLLKMSEDGNSPGKPVWIDSTNDSGQYRVTVRKDEVYQLQLEKDGYLNQQSDTLKGSALTNPKNHKFELEPVPREPIVVPNIYYHFDKASLKEASKKVLDTTILDLMTANPNLVLEIRSHTDSKGSNSYNQQLSQERARSVINYLKENGVDTNRLEPKGFGESRPIAPNTHPDGTDNPEGRQKNRRTEFKIIGELKGNKKVIYEE